MPVEFLSDDHLERYGCYQGDPSPEQLARHFVLTPGDLAVMVDLRHDHTRLGFALQLCSLRFLGTFLIEPLEVPALVVRTLCDQLGLQGTQNLPRYLERRATRFEHQLIIRDHLQYRDFVGAALLDYLRWLHARVRVGDERPTLLFDLSITYLNTQHVILPGATTLARVIVKFREQAAQHLYVQLERRLSGTQKAALERYLVVPEGERRTPYERLRFPPSNTSHLGLNTALERILSICEVGVSDVNVADLPAVRMAALSRHAEKTSTRVLIKLAQTRRHQGKRINYAFSDNPSNDIKYPSFSKAFNRLRRFDRCKLVSKFSKFSANRRINARFEAAKPRLDRLASSRKVTSST